MVFTNEKCFCSDEPDNISLCVENRGDGVIALHRVKSQMGDAGVMIVGTISTFGNLMIKVIVGKYNSLKYLYDLRITFSRHVMDNLARKNGFFSKTMRVSTLQKKCCDT